MLEMILALRAGASEPDGASLGKAHRAAPRASPHSPSN